MTVQRGPHLVEITVLGVVPQVASKEIPLRQREDQRVVGMPAVADGVEVHPELHPPVIRFLLLSFLIVQFAELSTRGAPLSRLRSIPGLRERAGIERLAQGERPHVLFTRGCYPGKTLLALPKGNTAKF